MPLLYAHSTIPLRSTPSTTTFWASKFDWSVSSVYAVSSCSGSVHILPAVHFTSFTPVASRPWWSSVALCHKVQFGVPVCLSYIRRTLKIQLRSTWCETPRLRRRHSTLPQVSHTGSDSCSYIHSRPALLTWLYLDQYEQAQAWWRKNRASLGWVQMRFWLNWQQWTVTPSTGDGSTTPSHHVWSSGFSVAVRWNALASRLTPECPAWDDLSSLTEFVWLCVFPCCLLFC